MSRFWLGFRKKGSENLSQKTFLLVLWSDKQKRARDAIFSTSFKFPDIKVKSINIDKDPTSLKKYSISKLPTIVLLKNGREVDRIDVADKSLIEDIFRRALA